MRGRDIVTFSTDWDGDPLSKMHLMRILAEENRVLWVDSLGNRVPRANAHDLGRIWKKFSTAARGLKQVLPNLHVLSPLALPLYGSEAARAANRSLLRLQLRRAMARLGFGRRIVSWSFLPAAAPVAGTLGEELVVYHCVDEFSAFSDASGPHIADLEERLLRKAHLCITSAERLRERKAKVNPNTVLVRHGVDFDHFVTACDDRTPVPGDIARLPRPILGFFGLLADWVDLDVFEACARAYPGGSVVILGKIAPGVDVSRLRAFPNVHLLGRKPYALLPGYCKAFDVALMPFRWNELTLHANPLKVREYLAAGLPCVSTPLPEVEAVGLCRLARRPEEYVQQVEACLREGPGPRRERAQRIVHESWRARVEEIRRHVADTLRRLGRADPMPA
jgi:glycosyltransferase involved in cell wall biosynthesis